ncbi:VWA domain-containing protein [Janibacter sp. GXQ6167]|uniref:vWA domain-containing protein n=1 Tax=Janibacter sp. GXQ6167 TaxID=3240791 RepID=UPI003524BA95
MSRRLSVVPLVLLLGLLLVFSSLSVPQATGSSRGSTDDKQTASARIGGCIAGGGRGQILLLIDRSGSLTSTDPTGARVDAAQYLVSQMEQVATSTSAHIDVAVAGFDATYERTLNWTKLTASSLGTVRQDLDSYRQANRGVDTDYWVALDGARKEIAQRTKGARDSSCSMIVWFSDGQFDIEPRDGTGTEGVLGEDKPYAAGMPLGSRAQADAARERGERDLCRPGGLADQVRSQQTALIGVGLSGSGKPDFTLMKNVATGGSGGRCGKVTSPAPGEFFLAENIEDLFFAFDAFSSPGREPLRRETATCQGRPCAEGTHTFVLDTSIGQVHALASTTGAGARVLVKNPKGETVQLSKSSGQKTVGGAKLAWKWVSESAVSVDITRQGDANWAGPWGLVFLADQKGKARSSLRIFGDLVPTWDASDPRELTLGEKTPLTFGLAHTDGKPVKPADVAGEAELSAQLVLRDGTTVPIVQGAKGEQIAKPVEFDPGSVTPGPAKVSVELKVTTADWRDGNRTVSGTVLEPQSKEFPVEVKAPANYPKVTGALDFGQTESTDPRTATLALDGEGCAWLTGETNMTATPEGVKTVTLASPAKDQSSCASGELEVTLTPSEVGNGLVGGDVTVMTAPQDGSAEALAVTVPFSLEMQRPRDTGVFLLVLIGVTLLGLLIPIGLLYGAKYLTARVPGTSVRAISVRGRIDDSESFLDAGAPIAQDKAQTAILEGNDRRNVPIAGKTLKAKVGLDPTGPGHVIVEQASRIAGAGSSAENVKGLARLPLAVQGHWIMTLDSTDPVAGDVEVTFFTAAGDPGLEEMIDDARSSAREVVASLRDQFAQDPTAAAPAVVDEWSTTPSSGGFDAWSDPDPAAAGNPTSETDSSRIRATSAQPPVTGEPPAHPPTSSPDDDAW